MVRFSCAASSGTAPSAACSPHGVAQPALTAPAAPTAPVAPTSPVFSVIVPGASAATPPQLALRDASLQPAASRDTDRACLPKATTTVSNFRRRWRCAARGWAAAAARCCPPRLPGSGSRRSKLSAGLATLRRRKPKIASASKRSYPWDYRAPTTTVIEVDVTKVAASPLNQERTGSWPSARHSAFLPFFVKADGNLAYHPQRVSTTRVVLRLRAWASLTRRGQLSIIRMRARRIQRL